MPRCLYVGRVKSMVVNRLSFITIRLNLRFSIHCLARSSLYIHYYVVKIDNAEQLIAIGL